MLEVFQPIWCKLMGMEATARTKSEKISAARRRSDEDWIALFSLLHKGQYTYGAVDRSARKIEAICPEHGAFNIGLGHHQQGKGCAACAGNLPYTTERFVAAAQAKHGGRFDYSQTEWQGQLAVRIVCREHGPFTTKPSSHLRGKGGCPKCLAEGRRLHKSIPHDEVLRRFRAAHGDRYDYDFSTYDTQNRVMRMVCREHGEFKQKPAFHEAGSHCPKCAANRRGTDAITPAHFLSKARAVHGDRYDYDLSTLARATDRVAISCPDHGEFWQIARNHYTIGSGCPRCAGNRSSKAELEILDYVREYFPDAVGDTPVPGSGIRVDVWIPSKRFALEYNGLYWHSEQSGKSRTYHLEKTRAAAAVGVQLVHIFEDEWLEKPLACKLRLMHILGLSFSSVGARKLEVRQVEWESARDFYDAFHLQGAGRPAPLNLGLFNADTPLAMMSFGAQRFGARKAGCYEMLRYAAACQVQGGFTRLLKHAIHSLPDATSLVSYADLRWSMGRVYEACGFVRESDAPPGYFWCRASKRFSRQAFQKHKLEALLTKFDPNKTEVQNCLENGYFRVFDCGHAKYTLNLKASNA